MFWTPSLPPWVWDRLSLWNELTECRDYTLSQVLVWVGGIHWVFFTEDCKWSWQPYLRLYPAGSKKCEEVRRGSEFVCTWVCVQGCELSMCTCVHECVHMSTHGHECAHECECHGYVSTPVCTWVTENTRVCRWVCECACECACMCTSSCLCMSLWMCL